MATVYQAASDQVISKRMDAEVVVINLQSGVYYCITGSGAAIWEGLVAGASTQDLSQALSQAHPACPDPQTTVDALAQTAQEADLIAPASGPGVPVPDLDWGAAFAPPELEIFDDIAAMVALDPPLPEAS